MGVYKGAFNKMNDMQNFEDYRAENTRLNQVILDLHDDMRRCKQKIKMQDHIIDTQQDIINAFCELVGMINDKE